MAFHTCEMKPVKGDECMCLAECPVFSHIYLNFLLEVSFSYLYRHVRPTSFLLFCSLPNSAVIRAVMFQCKLKDLSVQPCTFRLL